MSQPTYADRLLNIAEVCELLGMKKTWVYDLANTGKLPHYEMGRAKRFRLEDVLNYREAHRKAADVVPEYRSKRKEATMRSLDRKTYDRRVEISKIADDHGIPVSDVEAWTDLGYLKAEEIDGIKYVWAGDLEAFLSESRLSSPVETAARIAMDSEDMADEYHALYGDTDVEPEEDDEDVDVVVSDE